MFLQLQPLSLLFELWQDEIGILPLWVTFWQLLKSVAGLKRALFYLSQNLQLYKRHWHGACRCTNEEIWSSLVQTACCDVKLSDECPLGLWITSQTYHLCTWFWISSNVLIVLTGVTFQAVSAMFESRSSHSHHDVRRRTTEVHADWGRRWLHKGHHLRHPKSWATQRALRLFLYRTPRTYYLFIIAIHQYRQL